MLSRTPSRRISRTVAAAMTLLAIAACSHGPSTVVPAAQDESWWLERHRANLDRVKEGPVELLFLGDSITQRWSENAIWRRYYSPRHAANFGIDGDRIQNVLWRIKDGELNAITPKLVVLLIGTNNLDNASTEEIAEGVNAILVEIRQRLPKAHVLLLGLFPRGRATETIREKIRAVNDRLARLGDGKRVRYLDIGEVFLEPNGELAPELMPDLLHPNVDGYKRWAEAMEPSLREMLGEARGKP